MHDQELTDHPEGGRYKEVFRSADQVTQRLKKRTALTHIYFSLNKDEVSRFHKVTSDEVWNLYEGPGLILYIWDDENQTMDCIELSPQKREYCFVVKAGLWQAAMPIKERVLMGCSVAPGFEFQDFELLDPASSTAENILRNSPQLKKLISRF